MTRHDLKIRTQQAINAIRVFKEKDYGWSQMEKMLYEILLELDDSDWQTGIPPEGGLYLVYYLRQPYPNEKESVELYHQLLSPCYLRTTASASVKWVDIDGNVIFGDEEVVAWQKIEPYKEVAE